MSVSIMLPYAGGCGAVFGSRAGTARDSAGAVPAESEYGARLPAAEAIAQCLADPVLPAWSTPSVEPRSGTRGASQGGPHCRVDFKTVWADCLAHNGAVLSRRDRVVARGNAAAGLQPDEPSRT